MTQDELRLAIFNFDIERAKTSLNAVQGVITRDQADARLEFDVASLLDTIDKYTAEKVLESAIDEILGLFVVDGSNKVIGLIDNSYRDIDKRIERLQAELAQLKEKNQNRKLNSDKM